MESYLAGQFAWGSQGLSLEGLQQCYPSKEKLVEHRVEINNTSDFCGEEMEDLVHIIYTYSFAQEFWRSCPVSLPFNAGNFISFKGCVQ